MSNNLSYINRRKVYFKTSDSPRCRAAARANVDMPYVQVLKFNPNACDAPGGPIRLELRLKTLAEHAQRFLRTPAEEFLRKSRDGEANVPHVQCFFYHAKEGARILAHFNTHAAGAWGWHGNLLR